MCGELVIEKSWRVLRIWSELGVGEGGWWRKLLADFGRGMVFEVIRLQVVGRIQLPKLE